MTLRLTPRLMPAAFQRRRLVRLACLGGLAGVATAATATRHALAKTSGLRILAAASLKDALDALSQQWAQRGHARPVVVYGGTPMLARQLEQGAPADLIVSADTPWMDRLEQGGLIRRDTRGVLAGNRLALIAPARSAAALALRPGMSIGAALGAGRLAVADVRTVPAGRYARGALESLGVWAQVSDRLAMTDNVRAALALVAREEAPLGIVYVTDARAEPRVRVVALFDEALHPAIVYPIALTAQATHPDAAPFLVWLRSPEALAILSAQGLTQPRSASAGGAQTTRDAAQP